MAQDAASSTSTLPEAPERGYYVADLFGKAAYLDVAARMENGKCKQDNLPNLALVPH
jgi:hypothetical protein